MILLATGFSTSAFAAGLPWECPPIATAADANVYRDTDGGLGEAFDSLYDAAYAWWNDSCAWAETSSGDGYTSWSLERVCETGGVRVAWGEYLSAAYDTRVEGWSLAVEVGAGETWTNITLTSESESWSASGMTYGSMTTRTAAWSGAFDGLPDDGWFTVGSTFSSDFGLLSWWRSGESPSCAWTWNDLQMSDYDRTEQVSAAGHLVTVWSGYDARCEERGANARLDGAVVSAVDEDTWARDPADADGDGWVPAACDCDDADPAVSVDGAEVANDGIDQDCDGADLVDADIDRDGHDATAFGGADCDDGAASVFPGADDPPGDGIDQDCDGADDIDADGDGFTADGDRDAVDCDDADSSANPDAREVAYDGIDQDCDGDELTDVDGDGAHAQEVGGTDCDDDDASINLNGIEVECDGVDQDCDGADLCPPPDGEDAAEDTDAAPPADDLGCTGSAAWLLLTPLLGIRRKARR